MLAVTFLSVAAVPAAFAADPASAPVPATVEQRTAPEKAVPGAPSGEFTYGPILATDPEVRGQIKRLYREQWDFNAASNARILELSQQAKVESDGDLQMALQRETMELKKGIELKNVELGLQIARLNGDERRVADFEKALDQLTHPEKYLPPTLDPALAQQRRLGQK